MAIRAGSHKSKESPSADCRLVRQTRCTFLVFGCLITSVDPGYRGSALLHILASRTCSPRAIPTRILHNTVCSHQLLRNLHPIKNLSKTWKNNFRKCICNLCLAYIKFYDQRSNMNCPRIRKTSLINVFPLYWVGVFPKSPNIL